MEIILVIFFIFIVVNGILFVLALSGTVVAGPFTDSKVVCPKCKKSLKPLEKICPSCGLDVSKITKKEFIENWLASLLLLGLFLLLFLLFTKCSS